MARIRTIKPEFWTDERLADCSLTARLLLIASLNFADDYGNLERSSRQLKAQAFPYDQLECEPLVRELLSAGLMAEYKVADRLYLHIKGFSKHQRIEKMSEARFPKYEESLSTPQTVGEGSRTPPVVVTVLREGKGRESKGKERKGEGEANGHARLRSPGSRIPDDFQLTDERRAYAVSKRVDPGSTFEAFTTYWRSKSANATKLDWDLTWHSWVLREAKDTRQRSAPRKTRFDEIMEMRRANEQTG